MTDPTSVPWQEESLLYLQDLEEAFRRGILPSREGFRSMLGLDLILGIRVDYGRSIQEAFPHVVERFEIEGLNEGRSGFWTTPQSVGDGSGLRMVNMQLLDPGLPGAVSDLEGPLPERAVRYATLGEAIHFVNRNPGVAIRFPFVSVHRLASGQRAAVFIGSLSGREKRVIRFKPIDHKWRGCRHLVVVP